MLNWSYLTVRFHVASRSCSLVSTFNLKAKENIHAVTILLYYILQQYYLNKRHVFSKIYYHIVQQMYVFCGFSHCSSAYSKNHYFGNVTRCSYFTYMQFCFCRIRKGLHLCACLTRQLPLCCMIQNALLTVFTIC